MGIDISTYPTIIFDCDGVILDSNKVKSSAFHEVALAYGEEAADALVRYNSENGGISRFRKFDYFLKSIVPAGTSGPGLDELVKNFAAKVIENLVNCQVADGLQKLRQMAPDSRWMIVSGGAQSELNDVFKSRGLDALFDGGIFGNPDSKETILLRERGNGNIVDPALFVGDSRYDHEVAVSNGMDFVFVSDWTEFTNWESYFDQETPVIGKIADLIQ